MDGLWKMDKRRWGIGKDCGGWMEDGGGEGKIVLDGWKTVGSGGQIGRKDKRRWETRERS